ncbi:MAG: cupin domain-containing protein [Paenibacillaceae bacterium]|nr:cupin domain-containing protein [Paenibacillaceae bacterium]
MQRYYNGKIRSEWGNTKMNIETLSKQFIWSDEAGLVTKSLGEAAGSQKLYVNIDSVPPGAFSTKYHSHSQQEEFFLILSGKGTLRLNGQEQEVGKDDFIAKPAGKNIAHTFFNSGNEALVILDVGTKENEDTCYYPDEDVYMQKSNGLRRVFKGNQLDETWSSDPNC